MDAEEIEFTEDDFEEHLNDVYGDVNICGCNYAAGRALREIDPIAFRVGMSDMTQRWKCGKCGGIYEDEDEAEECCQEELEEGFGEYRNKPTTKR